MLYVESQHIQGLYENAVLNGEKEKEFIIHVRMGLKNPPHANTAITKQAS